MDIEEAIISEKVNHKVLNGLQILMSGRSLNYNGYGVKMSELIDGSYSMIMVVNDDGHIQGFDMKFSQLYKWLSEYDEKELSIKLVEITLQEINKKH